MAAFQSGTKRLEYRSPLRILVTIVELALRKLMRTPK